MATSGDFLMLRPDDLLVLGVRWSGFTWHTARTRGLLAGERAFLTVVLPAQAIAEQKYDGDSAEVKAGEISGASRLTFAVDRGTFVAFTAHGLTALLSSPAAHLVTDALPEDPTPTAIELPWHLTTAPVPRTPGAAVLCRDAAGPVRGPDDTTGLWQARLRASDGTPLDAGLALRILAADPEDAAGTAPLSAGDRQAILDASAQGLPEARRLELSALGGSLDAGRRWETFAWEHRTTVGRDERVHVQTKGLLYPFGHRAQLDVVAERTFLPSGVAGLLRTTRLTITEPIRAEADRALPFDEVEILQRRFEGLADSSASFVHVPLVPSPTDELAGETAALEAEHREKVAYFEQAFVDADYPPTFTDALQRSDWSRLQAEIAAEPDPARVEELRAQAAVVYDQIKADFDAQPRSAEDLIQRDAQTGYESWGARVLAIRARLAEIERQLAAVSAEQPPNGVFWTPAYQDGTLVRFPLRCHGANGDVFVAVPLVFVKDVSITREFFEPFHSLTDWEVLNRVSNAWAAHREIPLQGEHVDLVRGDGAALPGDVHELHAMTLGGVAHGSGFRAVLQSALAELPAVRRLLPGAPSRVPLSYSDEFLRSGADALVPLIPDVPIDVDFLDRPRLSGALAAPKFVIDGIARVEGLVPTAGLPALAGGMPDLEAVYGGATLLGFPLASLIAQVPGRPALPPQITDVLDRGLPTGVRMRWEDVELKPHGPFVPTPGRTKLALTVETSLQKQTTTCSVNDFELRLPPTGEPLLVVGFRLLKFLQEPGQAPDLQVDGVAVGFHGVLKFLKDVQEELQRTLGLPDVKPPVTITEDGIRARYATEVPSLPLGPLTASNLALSVEVEVPFTRKPVSVRVGVSSRERPFSVTVMGLGGGGWLMVEIGPQGIASLDASIEFGAALTVNLGIAKGTVEAKGGVRFQQQGGGLLIDGYFRLHGSVEVLGLVSVSVTLVISLQYDVEHERLQGRATLVITVDLTFYADSVTLDSGVWTLAGPESRDALPRGPEDREVVVDAWRQRQAAFA